MNHNGISNVFENFDWLVSSSQKYRVLIIAQD